MDRPTAAMTAWMAEASSGTRWPNQRPRDAATLIVVDRGGATLRVLMGKRHDDHKFMPGKFVFPGGRIELGDRHVVAASELSPRVEEALASRLRRPSANLGRALALTALRETYEETGLLIGRKAAVTTRKRGSRSPVWDVFRSHAVLPDLDRVTFVGRAITPPRRPKRFDTRFFAIDHDAIQAELPGFVGPGAELVEVTWVELAAARKLDLPAITLVMLDELEHRFLAGFGHDLPIPFFYQQHGRRRRDEI